MISQRVVCIFCSRLICSQLILLSCIVTIMCAMRFIIIGIEIGRKGALCIFVIGFKSIKDDLFICITFGHIDGTTGMQSFHREDNNPFNLHTQTHDDFVPQGVTASATTVSNYFSWNILWHQHKTFNCTRRNVLILHAVQEASRHPLPLMINFSSNEMLFMETGRYSITRGLK